MMPTSISLADVQRLSRSSSPRVSCHTYDAPAHVLPNGLPRTTPLIAYAQLVIGSEFIVTARILRGGPGQPSSLLQIEQRAWDTATGRSVLMPPYTPSLIRAVCDVMVSKQVLVDARDQAGKARN